MSVKGRPVRVFSTNALLDLRERAEAVRQADAAVLRAVVRGLADEAFTVEGAAFVLGVSEATLYRRLSRSREHESPGVGG